MAKSTSKVAAGLRAADLTQGQRTEQYVKVVNGLYDKAITDLSAMAVQIGLPSDGSTFSFPPGKQKAVLDVIQKMADRITSVIEAGDMTAWNAACAKYDTFVDAVLNTSKLTRVELAKYDARNLEALAAFQQRKVDGLNLSERVWKTVQPFKDEVELAIDTATGEGKSAAALSRDVRSCLYDPDKLFRRVRDKYGNLHLSKAAKLYHPGQGVYRSSYKNAMRMTRTEINMAYRQSDHMRWQQLDFVVGIQVQTSNNHTCLGQDGKPHRFTDICDELAGKYPKDFKFVGWHPQCRCFATPILKTLEEVDKDVDEEGNYRSLPSANEVKDVPANFHDYIIANADRMARWKNTPYYVKDNPQYIDKIFYPEKYVVKALELNAATEKLLSEYEMYGFNHQGSKKFNDALAAAKEAKLSGNDAAFQKAMDIMAFTKKTNDRITALRERKAAESVLTREQKIEQAAQKRHAARTEAKEKELLAFARKHAEETQRAYAEIDKVIARGSDYVDIDTTPLVDIRTAKTGVDVNGKTVGMSLERQRKAAQELNAQVDILIDNTKQYTDLIPDAADFLKQYSINEIDQAHRVLASTEILANGMPLNDLKAVIELRIKNYGGLESTLLKRRLKVVEEDIKIEAIVTDLKTLNITKTSIDPLKNLQQEIDAALAKRDIASADALLTQAKAMSPVATGYETLVKTGYHSGKFDAAMQKCLDALGTGDIKAAQDALNEAATIKATNEANVARRKAREAAKKQKEEEEPQKKNLAQATSYKDVKDIYGDKMPKTLEELEVAIENFKNVSEGLVNDRETLETCLRNFFEKNDYGLDIKHELLDSVLKKGFLNTFQTGTSQGHNGSTKTSGLIEETHARLGAAVRMFLPSKHKYLQGVKSKYTGPQLDRSEYEKYGHLLPKDKVEGLREHKTHYGDVQVRFKKDKVCPTWTYDDSLGCQYQPSLCCDPKIESFDGAFSQGLSKSDFSSLAKLENKGMSSYIELQYHGQLGVDAIESITFPKNPITYNLCSEKTLKGFANSGARIFYIENGKEKEMFFETAEERRKRILEEAKRRHAKRDAALAKMGMTKEDKIQALLKARAEEQAMAMVDVQMFLANKEEILCADITEEYFKKIEKKLASGNYLGARKACEEIAAQAEILDSRLNSLANIHDAQKWNKKFTFAELESADKEIGKKLKWLDTKYEGRDDPDRLIAKLAKEADYVEHPEKLKADATRYKTWEVAKEAYQRKRDEVIYKFRKDIIDTDIAELEAFKTADKEFRKYVTELKSLVKEERWGAVEETITKAKNRMIDLDSSTAGTKALKIGESSKIAFSAEEFAKAAKDAAKWFKAKGKTAAAMRKAYKEADDYMSQYAEAMWSKLTQEEKHVLWLYTDGSSYINEEMLGTYCLRVKSWIDGSFRNGIADANVLTSIIEKAPALKEGVWMQSGKSESAFKAIFGKDISRVDLQDLVGTEGKSNLFMSCHAARDGAFTKGTMTVGGGNNVILSVYLPKGTKGAYVEPLASYGDSKRGEEGLKWDGKKRKDEPSDQVEFILQRGSHFRITKAEYDKKTGKWYIDVELTEQEACRALKTTDRDFESRRIRYKAPAS